jgi:hypothetical protein
MANLREKIIAEEENINQTLDEEIIKLATKIPEIYSCFAAEIEATLQGFEKPTT